MAFKELQVGKKLGEKELYLKVIVFQSNQNYPGAYSLLLFFHILNPVYLLKHVKYILCLIIDGLFWWV